MRVVVPVEIRFLQTPDGSVWTDGTGDYAFWRRYLDVFERVCVVGRARTAQAVETAWKRVDGEAVEFRCVPDYMGPRQYAFQAGEVMAAAGAAIAPGDAVILRAPGQLANCVAHHVVRRGQPYGVEVLGDPSEVFRKGAVPHPLRSFFRWWFTAQLRRQCRHASAVAYVAGYLESRYPAAGYAVRLSDVELPSGEPAVRPKAGNAGDPFTVITVASLAQMYKGIDVLLDALLDCPGICLRIVGDGRYRSFLESRAETLGIAGRVCFVGQLPAGEAVRRELDGADLFVLPSRTEGLPRALIEAMARGLPCIGSAVGGIPELLAAEELVPPGDSAALADKILKMAQDAGRRAAVSARNLEVARRYTEEALRPRRRAFYETVRSAAEEWSGKRSRVA